MKLDTGAPELSGNKVPSGVANLNMIKDTECEDWQAGRQCEPGGLKGSQRQGPAHSEVREEVSFLVPETSFLSGMASLLPIWNLDSH